MSWIADAHKNEAWALFLDVDGTLLEIAETPQDVRVPDRVKLLLHELAARLDGALALVSGRSVADLDRLFDPLRLCASGVHGCERRDADGRLSRTEADVQRLAPARDELAAFVRNHEGLLLEDKGYGLAVHFRRAPQLAAQVRSIAKRVCENLGPAFALQAGKCVFEIRPAGSTKGSAIAAFMQQPPFRGRTPIFVGDDVTDEHGFAAVNELGGVSIRVGAAMQTLARHRLADVTDVIRWLDGMRGGDVRPHTEIRAP